jgi:hypothetical protein
MQILLRNVNVCGADAFLQMFSELFQSVDVRIAQNISPSASNPARRSSFDLSEIRAGVPKFQASARQAAKTAGITWFLNHLNTLPAKAVKAPVTVNNS